MSTESETSTPLLLPIKPLQGDNGMTDEQVSTTLAAAGRRKNDTEYLQTWTEGVAKFRRKIQEEFERELAEAEEAKRSKRLSERETKMTTTKEKPVVGVNGASVTSKDNGRITEEERQAILSIAGKYKDNPAYVEQLREEVREFRQKIQEELERQWEEEERAK